MDAAHDVEVPGSERLRQEIYHTSRRLEHDVERLQEVVRDRVERTRDVFRAPPSVMRHPLGACALAAVAGFVVSRRRTRPKSEREVEVPLGVAPRSSLREVGLAVFARAFESLLARGFRL